MLNRIHGFRLYDKTFAQRIDIEQLMENKEHE